MEPFVEKVKPHGPRLLYIEHWMQAEPLMTAGFSTRIGGVSTAQWESLNCAFHVADDQQHVIANRQLIAQSVGFPLEAWTCAEQVHGSNIYVVQAADRGKGHYSREEAIQDADALVTNEPDTMLVSFYADCVPLYFWDQSQGVIGLAHAGWKGTLTRIAEKMVEQMVSTYQCQSADIRAAIGPAIGACCYEVDKNVAERFIDAGMSDGITAKLGEKYRLDLKQLNRQIMIKAGVLPTHIGTSQYCTACQQTLFFSHRRDRGQTGRMISWIGMRNEVK